jgi:tetratricopeptide (TPR) repeat protein
MKNVLATVLALAVWAPGLATAQEPATPKAAAQPAASGEVRRDPKGIKGISPFWESLKKGDDLYVARDFDGAISAYQQAISGEPQNPMGHYRIGEAHLAKGSDKEAEASWVSALRFVGKNHGLKAKILFVLADLRERQANLEDATERWEAYAQFAKTQPETKSYPATAADRKKRIAERQKMVNEYAAVKARIEKRLKEADDQAKKNAK